MIKYILIPIFIFLFASCDRVFDVNYPDADENGFLTQTHPVAENSKRVMEGVYSVIFGEEYFGKTVVLKWNGDKLSIYTNKDAGFAILTGGSLDSVFFFKGYWRHAVNSNVGILDFYISSFEGGGSILKGDTTNQNIIIRGSYGDGENVTDKAFQLHYLRPFSERVKQNNFYVIAHRGGGRNSDYMRSSENSIEMIANAEALGANGIEIDVQLTKDGVPILYHDEDINLRLTQKSVLWGDIEDFTLAQLRTFVKLKNGEQIPTLEEALDFVVDNTKLRFVWLDLKSHHNEVIKVAEIQQRILRKINVKKRELQIVMGVPTQDKANLIMALKDYTTIPTLCELTTEFVKILNSGYWAPRWTLGTQNDLVNAIHAEGRKAFVWTLDEPVFIENFFRDGLFDGILTNYPMLVAYHHYIR